MSTGMKFALLVILLAAAGGGYVLFTGSNDGVSQAEESAAMSHLRPIQKKTAAPGATSEAPATAPADAGGTPSAQAQ
jgi:hypothetical protein